MTDKIRVIVTKLPEGYAGADEGPIIGSTGKATLDDKGKPVHLVTPGVLKLENPFGGAPWRARLSTSTPIPPEFLDALKHSGARWQYDGVPPSPGAEIEGAPV